VLLTSRSDAALSLNRRINNAGIALDGFDADVVEKTFALNYHDVTDFNERIIPILKPNGRIVILASMAGALNGYSPEIVQRFRSVSSKAEADELALEYQKAARDNIDTLKEKGWKLAAYSVSKVSCMRTCFIAC
jgi:carbonyl reductase 1